MGIAVALGLWFLFRTRARRSREVEKWARSHRAFVAPGWLEAVDRRLEVGRSIYIATLMVFVVAAQFIPRSGALWGLCIGVVPAMLVLSKGVGLVRGSLPPGPRVARLREVTLADYLPLRTRVVMWVASVGSCGLTVSVAVHRSAPLLLVPAVVMLLGAVVVEVAGARLAHRPEPAVDAAHLYLQDCFRVDAVRMAATLMILALFYLLWVVPSLLDLHVAGVDNVDLGLGLGVAAALGLMLAADVGANQDPVRHLRARLWPSLGRDQVLQPGQPLPTRGAVV